MALSGMRSVSRVTAVLAATMALVSGGASSAGASPSLTSIRAQEWWIDAMHVPDAVWPISTGKGITIAEIDSGVDADHPDLAGQVLPGQNFSALPGGADTDTDGHGTGMASFMVGTGKGWDDNGMYGLAPGAKILPLRIVPAGGNEDVFSMDFAKQMSEAIRAAADSSAQVINISMSQTEDESNVRNAVEYALSKGKLIVAAVGNDGASGNPAEYPAAFPGVVGVGETDQKGNVATESEYGPQVALTAPGANMYRACVGPTGYCTSHGTSDSTALVSASAALLWSVHPTWTADQVIRVLMNTANAGSRPGVHDPYFGYGLVRPRVALVTPGDPGAAGVNPLLPVVAASSVAPKAGSPGAGRAGGAVARGSGGGAGVLVGAGVGVLVLAGVGGVVVRRRRLRGRVSSAPEPRDPYAHLPR
ncbi:type VII secretion-associated serine protease mycosin [Streptacidiphilus sp. P02-A3a]|nr:type VII secretion-associated serine protease mycosin [Streptacidiphilus sp. P02-A3a]